MNRRIVLASRPEGEPIEANFRLEDCPLPVPADGQLLVQNSFLSIDPYMRGRMSDRASYARPVGIGEVMVGGTVGRVLESRAAGYAAGDLVVGYGGWQEHSLLDSKGRQVMKIDPDLPPQAALGVCGMPGVTAYFGVKKLGEPKAGETLVVSAASGAVGSVVGQLAKLMGCRAVGIAGGAAKCRHVVDELGFDACVDHRGGDLPAALAAACPDGIDVYFENVGGKVLEAVAPLLRPGARVPICGFVSQYNAADPDTPFTVLGALDPAPFHRLFLVWEWPDEYAAAAKELASWVKEGKLRYREDVTDGLAGAPRALIGVLRGENFGKKLVRLTS